jgi:hypothetical protein
MKKISTVIAGTTSAVAIGIALTVVGATMVNAAVAAEQKVAADKVMAAAAPAYLGATEYGATLDELQAASVEAKRVADEAAAAEAARVAAAEEAARVAAEQAAAQAAADEAARVAAPRATTRQAAPSVGPTQCPAGTIAGAVDGNGNESNCQATGGADGTPCVAYNDANECTAWYKP